MKRVTVAALAAAGIAGGAVGVASAAADNVGGGAWDHGTANGRVYSNYYHGSVCHGSSVQGEYYNSSGDTRAGVTARASAPDRPWPIIDKSYWRNSC
ncbi:lactococcin 972 family bacteriocin [Nocardiopsis baichengensis]|uniref:lactococcin 972 family bacteriocin n=1 Tax=Nocardiopsis baichengensis TaxID=280240 RepID=UPI001EF9DDFA|nr:lactococcin 972 family bacteriocin [Nocardiopsis baichengensis]